jgi:PilZ domain
MERLELRSFVRRDDRRAVALRGFALSETRDSDVVVSDLSYGGCQIRSVDSFQAGETFELRILKCGASPVEVCWVRDNRAGARFLGSDAPAEQSGV